MYGDARPRAPRIGGLIKTLLRPGSSNGSHLRYQHLTDTVSNWVSSLAEPQWRDLSRMSLDYLTIPAMSAEPERVFSGAKITLSDRRCRMGDDALEALECLQSRQRDGLIAGTREVIRAVEEMLYVLCEEDWQ